MGLLLFLIVIILLLGALPTWPYSRGWGYYPSGLLTILLILLILLALSGHIVVFHPTTPVTTTP